MRNLLFNQRKGLVNFLILPQENTTIIPDIDINLNFFNVTAGIFTVSFIVYINNNVRISGIGGFLGHEFSGVYCI